MNARLVGNDGVAFDIWQCRECALEQVHCSGIVTVMHHCGAYVGDEVLFDGKLIKMGEEGECLLLRQSGYELGERLGGQTKGFDLVAGGFKCALRFAEDNESFGNLLV